MPAPIDDNGQGADGTEAAESPQWPLPPRLPPPATSSIPRPALKHSSSQTHVPTVDKPQPAVIWDDRKSVEQSGRTFYTENSPPPSPSLRDQYSNTTRTTRSTGYGPYQFYAPSTRDDGLQTYGYGATPKKMKPEVYDYKYDHIAPPAPLPERKPLGMKRRTAWIIASVVALIVIIGVAVGVGVGVASATNKKDSSNDRDGAQAGPITTSIPPMTAPTATTTLQSATTTVASQPTATGGSSILACPAANNTNYDVPGSDRSFDRYCGIDYRGGEDGNAEDLAVLWTASVIDCIVNCAGYPGCVGVGWGVIEGDKGDNHRCWMKKKVELDKATVARPGWDFAILAGIDDDG